MATVTATINVPDANEIAIRRDMAYALGWTDTVKDENGVDIPNPVTRVRFVQQAYNDFFREWFRNTLKAYRNNEALKVIVDETITTPTI